MEGCKAEKFKRSGDKNDFLDRFNGIGDIEQAWKCLIGDTNLGFSSIWMLSKPDTGEISKE